jgi:hypothetical protein
MGSETPDPRLPILDKVAQAFPGPGASSLIRQVCFIQRMGNLFKGLKEDVPVCTLHFEQTPPPKNSKIKVASTARNPCNTGSHAGEFSTPHLPS